MSKLMRMISDAPLGGGAYAVSAGSLLICMLCALVIGGFMMLVYKLCHDSLTYDKKFNVTLMMLTLASTVLLALIQNNPAFSLGALGALSICRIRANTRDPRDLGFVFWALSIGISCALGAFIIGAMGSLILGGVMLTIGRTAKKKDVLTMIVRGRKEQVEMVQNVFSQTPGSVIQSKNIFRDSFELVYALKLPQAEEEKLLLIFNSMEGVEVNVLAPQTQVA